MAVMAGTSCWATKAPIVRTFNADGTPKLNSDGSWHRDIVLEDYGTVTGTLEIGNTPPSAADMALAQNLFGADLVIAGGTYDAAGNKVFTANGAWKTTLTFVKLVAANNDILDGGDGNDVLIGQRGDDQLAGGAGDDLVVGDSMNNTLPYEMDLPKVMTTLRLFSADHPADGPALTAPDNAGGPNSGIRIIAGNRPGDSSRPDAQPTGAYLKRTATRR